MELFAKIFNGLKQLFQQLKLFRFLSLLIHWTIHNTRTTENVVIPMKICFSVLPGYTQNCKNMILHYWGIYFNTSFEEFKFLHSSILGIIFSIFQHANTWWPALKSDYRLLFWIFLKKYAQNGVNGPFWAQIWEF